MVSPSEDEIHYLAQGSREPQSKYSLYESLDIPKGTLLWKACSPLTCGFVRPHVVREGPYVFTGGGYTGKLQHSRTVFRYDIRTNTWSALEISPCHSFCLTVIDDMVTILGGINVVTSHDSNVLYSYRVIGSKGKWCVCLPPMLTKRSCGSVEKVDGFVIVAGGVDGVSRHHMRNVEVLDIQSKQWFTAPPLSMGVSFMCMKASKDSVFVAGGLGETGAISDVMMCDIQKLVQAAKMRNLNVSIWEKVTSLPLVRPGCAVVQDKLVTFGGIPTDDRVMDNCQCDVYCWRKELNAWEKLGNMPVSQSSMSAVTISPNRVMLIGGYRNARSWTTSLSFDIFEVVNILDECKN